MSDSAPTPATSTTATATPSSVTTDVSIKPGMSTSEFLVTMLIIALGAVLASGLLVNNTAVQIAGVVMTCLKAVSYTWARTLVKTAALLLLLVFGARVLTGCASTQRTTAINVVDTMTDAAGAALASYSHAHVEAIIHSPGISAVDAKAQMTAWYARVAKAEADITALRGLIKVARAQNDKPSVTALEAQAATILAELKTLEAP